MEFWAISDAGKVREKNEDYYDAISGDGAIPHVFIIADGMGGHNSGEIASRLAVDHVKKSISAFHGSMNPLNALDYICKTFKSANAEVINTANQNTENSGMGTTMLVVAMFKDKLFVVHAGDSRAYLIRNQSITQLTTDHSYTEELIKKGSISREEAETHPNKHLITKALGCAEDLKPDTYSCKLEPGDMVLMCTDGLTNMICDHEIMECIMMSCTLEQMCNRMIATVNKKGGEDNSTVIIIKN